MTKDELIELAREGMEMHSPKAPEYIVCAALIEALAQPEPKYHRGNRLICLETEEYCVIHISGTDRQWIKFPDSHIGVYTNEQVAELFELLPKEPEPWEKFCDSNCVWTDHHPDCKLAQKRCTPNCEQLLEKIVLQRKPLTIEQLNLIGTPWHFNLLSVKDKADLFAFARAIESAHGIENKA